MVVSLDWGNTQAYMKRRDWKLYPVKTMDNAENLSFASASISASSSLSFNSFSTDILNSRMSLMNTDNKMII